EAEAHANDDMRRKRYSRLLDAHARLTARGESLAAFDERCIPAGCVVPRSNTPGILGRRALPAWRLARLGATPDFHPGLLRHNRQVPAGARGQLMRAHIRGH